MNLPRFRMVCSVAILAIGICTSAGQTNGPVTQNGPRAAAANAVRGSNVRPNNSNPPYVPRGPVNVGQRSSSTLPTQMQNQPPTNFRLNYPSSARQLDPNLAAIMTQQRARLRHVQPRTSILAKNEFAENPLPFSKTQPNVTTSAQSDLRRQDGKDDEMTAREARQTRDKAKWHNRNHPSYSDALRVHHHEWHDRNWWRQHCNTIVFITGGYYFLDAGYWYPAWGYDPLNSYYDYDGPIYTYGNLLPDQVIANVQAALQEAGYYSGPVTGSLSVETRAALANFQRDQGLIITGAIDEPTVEVLGLY
jgi:Putative peptidoglycan binding domain